MLQTSVTRLCLPLPLIWEVMWHWVAKVRTKCTEEEFVIGQVLRWYAASVSLLLLTPFYVAFPPVKWSVVSAGIRRVTPRHDDRHRHRHDERHRRDTSRWVSRYNPSLDTLMSIGRLTLALPSPLEPTRLSRHLFSVFSVSDEIHSRRFNPFFTSSIFRLTAAF